MGTDQIHITWIYKKMSCRAICHRLYFESRLCRSSIPPRMFNVSDSDLFLGVQWGVTIKPPSSPVGIVEEEERKMEKRSRHLGLKGRWGWGGPDKNIRSMAQQGLCHPKFSKCVQNKQSDWSDFKGSSKQAIWLVQLHTLHSKVGRNWDKFRF